MKFTIVFPSHESSEVTISALFIPCLVWTEDNKELLNPHRDQPHYLKGDFQKLFAETKISERIADYTKKVTIVAHSTGDNATNADLERIVEDLTEEGFDPFVVHQ